MSEGNTIVTTLMKSQLLQAEWVLYFLLLLSVISVLVVSERIWVLFFTGSDGKALTQAINTLLTGGDLPSFKETVAELDGLEAGVLSRSLATSDKGADAVQEVMEGLLAQERLKLERGLTFLGTVGSNAPFVGLFGTVLGIIRAFNDLAAASSEGSEAVMAGIAEALVATAVGLLVAIPAVVAFNYLARRVKTVLETSGAFNRLVVAHLRGE